MFGFDSKTKKILIVEDDQHNHGLFQKAFSEAGFEVHICPDVDDDFVEFVTAVSPDIISMDLMIAKHGGEAHRDGFEAIELLKADKRTKDIPVIVLSSFHEETKIARAKAVGAVDFINLQGQSLPTIAAEFMSYLQDPKKYKPNQAIFRE